MAVVPEIQRPVPPYLQVADHLREQILSGELADGDPVPSVRRIADLWGVSRATATKVLAALHSEGLVRTIQGVGTVVSVRALSYAPRDRLLSVRRTGRIYPPDEYARIVTADLVEASPEIADALRVEPGSAVIRRHRVTHKGDAPVSSSTSWFDGDLAEVAPKLLSTERVIEGTFAYIEQATKRRVVGGRDQLTAGAATPEIAADLGVPEGSPVLLMRNWIYDERGGVIEYGEYTSIAGRWAAYDYGAV